MEGTKITKIFSLKMWIAGFEIVFLYREVSYKLENVMFSLIYEF